MLHFLRNIRKKLIIQENTRKYLLYAVGEIILVVIGILLAMQINNWNEQRIEDRRVDKMVQKLIIQTEKNITTTENAIKDLEDYYLKSLELVEIIGLTEQKNLDLKIDTLILNNIFDFHLNLDMNVITESRENGDLTLLNSDQLIQRVYEIISFNDVLRERERITNEDLNLIFIPYLNKNYNFRNGSYKIFQNDKDLGPSLIYKGDNKDMLKDQQFENYIFTRLQYNQGNLGIYNSMLTELKDFRDLLLTNQSSS